MLKLSEIQLVGSKRELTTIPEGKVLINTINAHSYNVAQQDGLYAEALVNGDYLIPDGESIVKACRWLKGKSQPKERIAGWDLFSFEMERVNDNDTRCYDTERGSYDTLRYDTRSYENEDENDNVNVNDNDNVNVNDNHSRKRVMFMGSSERVLELIRERAAVEYPNLEVMTYSPPYKPEFSDEDNRAIIQAINEANPDLLWIGMTAPKQEKWTYSHWTELDIHCHVGTIGAVFDFYAGTAKRAPLWWQKHGLEWLYRLLKEPKRMWRRYVIGNPLFVWNVIREKTLR